MRSKMFSVVFSMGLLLAASLAQTANSNGTRLRPDSTPAPTGNIAGTVSVAGNGSPLSGATVFYFNVSDIFSMPVSAPITTASDGTYTINGLTPGTYIVGIGNADFLPVVFTVKVTGTTTVNGSAQLLPQLSIRSVCSPSATSASWVVHDPTGFPIAYTYAILNGSASGSSTVGPGDNPLTTSPVSNAGPIVLQIMVAGMRDASGADTAGMCSTTPGIATLTGQVFGGGTIMADPVGVGCGRATALLNERLTSDLSVSHGPRYGGPICVGKPVSGASITVEDETNSVLGSTTTDSTGHYTIGNINVSAGHTYSVTVSATGYLTFKQTISLSGGKTTTLNVELVPVPTPLVFATVRIMNGCSPVVSSKFNSVQILDATNNKQLYAGFTDANGNFIPTSLSVLPTAKLKPAAAPSAPTFFPLPLPFPQGHALIVIVPAANAPVNIPVFSPGPNSDPVVKLVVYINNTTCP